ncbi:hypothetical protein F0L17_25450 [Streptomyces sp. TRM43335]|uniref:Uncharacterized protein n=1 Tax=Streptomyces taklimakanensis TaxID=2569853 RepID=A0A6G2BJC2_9ACTN|nr:hypothetical protein [Streptomyces taklimakanensis]MTE22387.1 hypothetical protein [Streptomyces taklimakanensis]
MNLKEHATRVAVLKVLRDAVEDQYQAMRREVLDELRAARAEYALKSIRVTLRDGTPIATITLIDPKPGVVVADEDAFTTWVIENHPGEVETLVRVRPSWRKQFVAQLAAWPDPVTDPHTGEVIPGLEAAPAPEPRSFSLRPVPGGTEQVARAWRTGEIDLPRLLALDSGEGRGERR